MAAGINRICWSTNRYRAMIGSVHVELGRRPRTPLCAGSSINGGFPKTVEHLTHGSRCNGKPAGWTELVGGWGEHRHPHLRIVSGYLSRHVTSVLVIEGEWAGCLLVARCVAWEHSETCTDTQ